MSTILLTGASGRLGTHMRRWFAEKGRAVLATDIRPAEDGGVVEIADLADRAAVDRLMARDISGVVHLGGMAKEAGWQTVLDANIVGTYNVFEAARKAGVKRVVYASTYHVVGMYPTPSDIPLDLDTAYRPDSLYAVSKIFGETLGRLYFDKFGVEGLAIRICTAGDPGTPREARLWLNRDDLAQLIATGLDQRDLGHRIVYGVSANPLPMVINEPAPGLQWVPAHGSKELGSPDPLEPLDEGDARNRLVGGAFSTWGHQDDQGSKAD
ncbi:NAD(P)-dependent oxidoreductase [Devosia sp.]|uniref:NAD-dependent epimerase/dehydratase family protein n=1 Tax=Devosia sp. TaxID=1871048 RepID=UPI001AC7FF0C|nr:NAD(P)-dependent oxidoreductase [Devosia sp.]MBN9335553.1 NAD(P)-dependent oxidoreductase [Devosia sp.]